VRNEENPASSSRKLPAPRPGCWLSAEQLDELTRIAFNAIKRGDSPAELDAQFVQWLEVNVSAELAQRGLNAADFAQLLTIGAFLCGIAHKRNRL